MAKQKQQLAYVRIQSSFNINVTMGLQNQDVTNADAHVPDRLKVNALWPKLKVLIQEGAHWYPSEIAEWNSVKDLAAIGILTIGQFSDTCDESEPDVAKTKSKLNSDVEEAEKRAGIANLNELAGE